VEATGVGHGQAIVAARLPFLNMCVVSMRALSPAAGAKILNAIIGRMR
jgi:hypothetical protein